ncbi:MAG: phosphoribosylglycinamide formyltransferase [Bacteroidales bacterium]|nr:phosphoribosylglycinamide formyltransferase [Bacteroidales bacterium]
MTNKPIRIAILASGNGTNAQQITEHFATRPDVQVSCIIYNKKDAYVAERAKNMGVESHYFCRKDFMETDSVLNYLRERQVDWLVLAGFLLLVPQNLLDAFPGHIINIHPALLPNHGGKGMYGHFVHEAVVANREATSGITIHLVDERFDHGTILFQARCKVAPSDTPDDLAAKIHTLEKTYYPSVVEAIVKGAAMPLQDKPLE